MHPGKITQRRAGSNREWVYVLLDVSPSMDSDDYRPSRKAGAIEANTRFIENKAERFPQDRIGIIAFDENAHLLHPAASAGAARAELLESLHQPIPVACGTDFAAALELAGKQLGDASGDRPGFLRRFFLRHEIESSPRISSDATRRIILLTDGEHNGNQDPVKIAKRLKNTGIHIECVGIAGSPDEVDQSMLQRIASVDESGRPCYCFIGDTSLLIRKYQSLANQLRPV